MKNLTIGKKRYISFGVIILLVMIMGGISICQTSHITAIYDELTVSMADISNASYPHPSSRSLDPCRTFAYCTHDATITAMPHFRRLRE
jgi:hypothetical protein